MPQTQDYNVKSLFISYTELMISFLFFKKIHYSDVLILKAHVERHRVSDNSGDWILAQYCSIRQYPPIRPYFKPPSDHPKTAVVKPPHCTPGVPTLMATVPCDLDSIMFTGSYVSGKLKPIVKI